MGSLGSLELVVLTNMLSDSFKGDIIVETGIREQMWLSLMLAVVSYVIGTGQTAGVALCESPSLSLCPY